VQTVREALLVLDADLRVKFAAGSFYQTFKVTPGQTEGRLIYEMGQKLIGGGMPVAKTLPGLRQLESRQSFFVAHLTDRCTGTIIFLPIKSLGQIGVLDPWVAQRANHG